MGIQFSSGNGAVVEEEVELSNGNGPVEPEPLNDNNKNESSSNDNGPDEPEPLNDNNKNEYSDCKALGFLPPMALDGENPNKKTLVLDLDGTLVHASRKPMPAGYDFSITFPGRERPTFYVLKRPGVNELLQQLGAAGLYEIVVFTAASKHYADAVVDGLLNSLPASEFSHIHKYKYVIPPTHRLSSGHCRKVEEVRDDVKDLSMLGRDLKNVIFVDDRWTSYYLQPENAIAVSSWVGEDSEDKSLFKILSFCLRIANSTGDVRELIYNYLR